MNEACHQEAARLLALGYKLCELKPRSKEPVRDEWNAHPVQSINPHAGGYGLILAANGMCSIDPDNVEPAREGLARCGFDLEHLMNAGCRTTSTRPGSGGRATFRAPRGSALEWITFTSRQAGTILELRAQSTNLQDSLPGTIYTPKKDPGRLCEQQYAGAMRLDDAPYIDEVLPEFYAWWLRLSNDLDYRREQQQRLSGEDAFLSISCGGVLAFESSLRGSFNESHDVADLLREHEYTEDRRGRFSPSSSSSAPGIRSIRGKDGLWQSDHASDPLRGTFDAWSAYVVLQHGGDLDSAEDEYGQERALTLVDGFDEVPVLAGAPEPLPDFKRTKTGEIKATRTNLHLALNRPDVCGFEIQRDAFRGEVVLARHGSRDWRPLTDSHYSAIGIALEQQGFLTMTTQAIREAVAFAAEKNPTDSARVWLTSLRWDGAPRVAQFLPRYLRTADTAYTAAVSRYLWTALAGRVLAPGVKADMVPVLVGTQGVGKSSAVASISPSQEFFGEIDLSTRDDDIGRAMRAKLVMELGELRGLKTREAEAIKAFISRTHDEWVPKYMEHAFKQPRRCLFLGTSNERDFLLDATGNRRWLPFEVGVCDVPAIEQDREQLWAEGATLFAEHGVMHHDAQTLAAAEHDAFSEQDEWTTLVKDWLYHRCPITGKSPFDRQYLKTAVVLMEALEMTKERINPKATSRVKRILEAEGYTAGYTSRPNRERVMFPPSLF